MLDFFDTISSFFNKIVVYTQTLVDNIVQSVNELRTWSSFLPASLIAAAGIIIVLLVIFRILGR